jgi:hypothetical protein
MNNLQTSQNFEENMMPVSADEKSAPNKRLTRIQKNTQYLGTLLG